MSETTAPIAGGTTGALPDAAVAIDRIAGSDYQRTKLTESTTGSTTATGVDANPLKVLNRRRGTADYDSGLVSVTNGAPASVTTATIYPEGGTLSNPGAIAGDVTLTNTANGTIAVITMAPKSAIQLPVPRGGSWVGLKVGATVVGIVLQVSGAQ
jgi:hypothetical protein